jgi:hypothetical protein
MTTSLKNVHIKKRVAIPCSLALKDGLILSSGLDRVMHHAVEKSVHAVPYLHQSRRVPSKLHADIMANPAMTQKKIP